MTELIETVLVNGEKSVVISVTDRGLQYGHGLFETIAIKHGQPQYWDQHMVRLVHGCERLLIKPPDPGLLKKETRHFLNEVVADSPKKAVLKIIYTAGESERGYKPPEMSLPNRILSISDWPNYPDQNNQTGVVVRFCDIHLGSNEQLAGVKHLNRLEQVLARSEWDDPEIAEGLILDRRGQVIEGTMSNVFFVKNDTLCTPDLSFCGVAGVMRDIVVELAKQIGINVYISDFSPADILQADEVFLTNSLIEIWPVQKILSEETVSYSSPGRITKKLQEGLHNNNQS